MKMCEFSSLIEKILHYQTMCYLWDDTIRNSTVKIPLSYMPSVWPYVMLILGQEVQYLRRIYPTSKGYEILNHLTLRKGPPLSKKPLIMKGVASKKSIFKYDQIII